MKKALLLTSLLIISCTNNNQSTPSPSASAKIANPASTFCIQQGGTLDIRKDTKGGETGYCTFQDKSECEEWKFFNGECQKGQNKK